MDAATRASDALRVAKRARAAGQTSAALRFVQQSISFSATLEAQMLLEGLCNAECNAKLNAAQASRQPRAKLPNFKCVEGAA